MRRLIVGFGLAAVLGLSGCKERPQMNNNELIESLCLPPGAENVRLLNPPDGSWHTFDLHVRGRKQHILRHYGPYSRGGVESMVVIPER